MMKEENGAPKPGRDRESIIDRHVSRGDNNSKCTGSECS